MSAYGGTPAPLPPLSPPCSDPSLYLLVLVREPNCSPGKNQIHDILFPLQCGYILDTFSCIASVISKENNVTCDEQQIMSVIRHHKVFIKDRFSVEPDDCEFDHQSSFCCMNPNTILMFAETNNRWPVDILQGTDRSQEEQCAIMRAGFDLTFEDLERSYKKVCTEQNIVVSMMLFSPWFQTKYNFHLSDCLGSDDVDETGSGEKFPPDDDSTSPPSFYTTPSPVTLGPVLSSRFSPVSSPSTKRPLVVGQSDESSGNQATTNAIIGVFGGLIVVLLVGILVAIYLRKKRRKHDNGTGSAGIQGIRQGPPKTESGQGFNNINSGMGFSKGRERRPSGEYCELKVPANDANVYTDISTLEKPNNVHVYADLSTCTDYFVTGGILQSDSMQQDKEADVYYLEPSQINTPANRSKLPVPNSS